MTYRVKGDNEAMSEERSQPATLEADSVWVTDANGNRNSIKRWGSREAAQAALDSLKNCIGCIDCSYCIGCIYCSYCRDCSDCCGCSHCGYCSYCIGCIYCNRCSYCSYCRDCSDCCGCSHCGYCSYCIGCIYCNRCSYCSHCSHCSDCSDCSDCSYCSGIEEKTGIGTSDNPSSPPIPVIDNIHAKVLAAASLPGALDMATWENECKTTHCRAGIVVQLAGEAGYAMRGFYGWALAAQLIYRESNPALPVSPARFFETNEQAMADMRRMAQLEAEMAVRT